MTDKTKDFIDKAKQIHGDKYDYSKVEYINNLKEIIIYCRKHGVFLQTPKVHKKGGGCGKCVGKNKTTDEFINESQEIHGDKYDYSNTIYIDAKTNVTIKCKTHGKFEITPNKHISSGRGCQMCSIIEKKNKSRDTKDEFVEKAKEIHGDKYDYSDVNYIDGNKLIKIKCHTHGYFSQLPKVHKKGHGCQKCGKNYRMVSNEFVEKAKEIHGNKYDYSKVNYIDNKTKIIIICNKHGQFEQSPNNHLTGYGCLICGFELNANLKRKSNEKFIEEANLMHKNKYDYSMIEYLNSKSKITIICNKHGEFKQIPSKHLKGQGCKKCSGNYTLLKEEFIEKAIEVHGNKFIYSNVKYINNKTPIEINCKFHGIFLQIPYIHLKGHSCPKCSRSSISEKQIKNNNFVETANKIFKNEYDYSLVNYQGSNIKVKIICNIHGIFEKTPDNHVHKTRPQGCQKCQIKKQYSKKQIEWLNFIQLKDNIIIQHAENNSEFYIPNTKYRADGFCQETNTIYEFHGDYWHGNPNKFISSEINKTTNCSFGELYQKTLEKENYIKNLGFNLITIWESDWNKLNNCVFALQRRFRNSK